MPKIPFTEKLSEYFKQLWTDTVFFENEQQIDDYIKREDYNNKFDNGTRI